MVYNFMVIWCEGSTNTTPDALSHYPVSKPNHDNVLAEQNEDHSPALFITKLRIQLSGEIVHLQDLWKHAKQDDEYR